MNSSRRDLSVQQVCAGAGDGGITILDFIWYGGECSFENVAALKVHESVLSADMIFAVGGGKAVDTCKAVAYELRKPVYTFPTIASNCAACTSVSIMYHADGSFLRQYFLDRPPAHTFIDLGIIAASPSCYTWAGPGDTCAKFFESSVSSRGEQLPHYVRLGVNVSAMCLDPILEYGEETLRSAAYGQRTGSHHRQNSGSKRLKALSVRCDAPHARGCLPIAERPEQHFGVDGQRQLLICVTARFRNMHSSRTELMKSVQIL